MATFKLRVSISGLCLFVRQADHVQVLLPPTGPSGGHGTDKHDARLVYDLAYEVEDSPAPEYEFASHVVEGHALKLLPTVSSPPPPVDDQWVVDLTKLTNRKARKELLGAGLPAGLTRLTLTAGKATGYGVAAVFDVSGDPAKCKSAPIEQTGTRAVIWTIENLPGSTLDLAAAWPSKPYGVPDTLHALDGVIDIAIAHAIPSEQPPKPTRPGSPKECDPAHHFHGFYGLLTPPNTVIIPRWKRRGRTAGITTPLPSSGRGIEPITCLVAQAEPE